MDEQQKGLLNIGPNQNISLEQLAQLLSAEERRMLPSLTLKQLSELPTIRALRTIFSDVPTQMPAPQADLSTPAGKELYNSYAPQPGLRIPGYGVAPRGPTIRSEHTTDYSDMDAGLIGGGYAVQNAYDTLKQGALNAQYLGAAMIGSPSAAEYERRVKELKKRRAEDDLRFERLRAINESAGVGSDQVSGFFSPSPIPMKIK